MAVQEFCSVPPAITVPGTLGSALKSPGVVSHGWKHTLTAFCVQGGGRTETGQEAELGEGAARVCPLFKPRWLFAPSILKRLGSP